MKASWKQDMVSKAAISSCGGLGQIVPSPPDNGSNGAALGIGNPPPHRVIQREPGDSRCAGCCEVVHARGRNQASESGRKLCDGDDLVQALQPWHTRGRSLTNTALENMQGVWCTPIPELRPGMRAIYPEELSSVE